MVERAVSEIRATLTARLEAEYEDLQKASELVDAAYAPLRSFSTRTPRRLRLSANCSAGIKQTATFTAKRFASGRCRS
jgi:hypothetical protein